LKNNKNLEIYIRFYQNPIIFYQTNPLTFSLAKPNFLLADLRYLSKSKKIYLQKNYFFHRNSKEI
ncbi:MAG: hypothetical protein FWD71_23630, partial [Oscillospiraceae bacterium]|nr:hypothetical protein [Oscillospiraceae bacterium]